MKETFSQRLQIALRVLLRGTQAAGLSRRDLHGEEQEVPPLTAEEAAEARQFFPCQKYFIFGHARSGTTLLTRLIRLHPQVHCNYQAHFFTRPPQLQSLVADAQVRTWLARRSNRWNRGKDLAPVVLRAAADFILEREARLVGKPIVGDKSPNSLLNGQAVKNLHDVYPDARLIFIVRDGRDAIVSHRFQQFIDVVQHLTPADLEIRAAFTQNPELFLGGERSIFTEKGIRQAVSGWVTNVSETDREGRALFGEGYISLRYEDMLKNPAVEMKRLWAFLGADVSDAQLDGLVAAEMAQNPDADWQRQKAGGLVSPLEKGKSGSWRSLFTQRDRAVFKEAGGDTLVQWGYEQDLDW